MHVWERELNAQVPNVGKAGEKGGWEEGQENQRQKKKNANKWGMGRFVIGAGRRWEGQMSWEGRRRRTRGREGNV